MSTQLTHAPLGSAEQRAPLHWGGDILSPPEISRTTQLATSGKRRWIALCVNSLRHVNFLKIEVTGQVKLRSKVKYYSFLQWRILRPNKALYMLFLSGRSEDSHSKVLKCPWDGAKQRSGQGQVAKGQLSNMKRHGHAAHVFRSSFKKEFTCNSLRSVSKTLKRPND